MTQRDFIEEIENNRASKERFLVNAKLGTLENILKAENVSGELTHFFPVILVACLETYFRAAIRDLIDLGSPYIDNCAKLKDLKFDINIIKAIHNKRITVGDFISHLINISSVEQIDSYMSTILGCKFLASLPSHKRQVIVDSKLKKYVNPLSRRYKTIYKNISSLFRIRHQISHEVSLNIELDKKTLEEFFVSVTLLIEGTEILIENIFYPNGVPQSTYDWREYNGKEYEAVVLEIKASLKKIKTLLKRREKYAPPNEKHIEREQLKELHQSWEDYQKAHSWFVADLNAKGGSAWPLFYMGIAKELAEDMLEKYQDILTLLKDERWAYNVK